MLCLDHIYLGSVRLFHAMEHSTRFSAAYLFQDASMDQAVIGFQSCWISQFWLPSTVRADKAFMVGSFRQFCKDRDIKLAPIPLSRHSFNAIKSKHGIIRSIFFKLSRSYPDALVELLALQAVAISNDLYGNDTLSAFELAKGFTKPVDRNHVRDVLKDIVDAQLQLSARRKMALILKSKSTFEEHGNVRDMVEVYNKTGMGKRSVWSTSKTVLSITMMHDRLLCLERQVSA